MFKFPIQFLWDEDRTRRLFKISLIIYIAGSSIPSIYGLVLPPNTPFHTLIILAPLITILTSFINLLFINRGAAGGRFLITNLIVQTADSFFMAITGGFSSPLQYGAYALLIITLFQLGPDATLVMGIWSVLTFIGVLMWQMHIGGGVELLLTFFVYTTPYILFIIIGRNIGKELSLQFEARKRLEEVDDLKNQFISLSSHYLRTPLTSLKGFAANLQKTALTGEQTTDVANMLVSVKNLEFLTEEMLSITEIEKGKQKIVPISSNLDALITSVIADYQAQALVGGIALNYNGPADHQANFSFDPLKMKAVVSSLIDNAIKFNHPSGRVDASLYSEDGNYIIKVADTGEGMTDEQRKGLFTSFNRGSMQEVFNMTHPGAGLSLYLAKLIVEAHQGKIDVTSVKGQGSTFLVTLPVKLPT